MLRRMEQKKKKDDKVEADKQEEVRHDNSAYESSS